MMKSTGIINEAIYTKEGKIGIVKDIIIESGPSEQEILSPTNTPKRYASPDWWVSHFEIELDETFKKELIAAKKLVLNKPEATITLKLTGFGKGAINLTGKGIEIKATKAQAGDNIGTLEPSFKKLIKIAKPKLSL
jgi:hypothetical protein